MGWSFVIGGVAVIIVFAVLMAVLGRMRRDVGGGFGPTERTDGAITTQPTGYPEDSQAGGSRQTSPD